MTFNYYWKKKDFAQAEKWADKLVKLGVKQAQPYWEKSILYQAKNLGTQKKYDQAVSKLNYLLKSDSNNENALKLKEWIYQTQYNDLKEQNEYSKMLDVLSALRKIQPSKEEYETGMIKTYWTWGKSYIEGGQFNKGIDVLSTGFKKFPDSDALKDLMETSFWNYAVLLVKQGKLEDAINILKRANDKFGDTNVQRNDFIAELYLRLSIESNNKGDRSKAMTYAEKGLIYNPESASLKAQLDNLKRGKDSIEEEKMEFAPWE